MPAIRIKFVGRGVNAASTQTWRRQISEGKIVGNCEFDFNFSSQDYDWLVVYDDMPRLGDSKRIYHIEALKCAAENTILITSEPSSVRRYPRIFLNQFNYILSSQEPAYISHSGHIHRQCGLRWYYGLGSDHSRSVDDMIANPPLEKSCNISAIVSSKKQRHTLHAKRVDFIETLGKSIPALQRFGHGIRAMNDKAEALDPFRYHIAIENHIAPHHWTEKLADAFLGCTLPFYVGAPDVFNYFPDLSLIQLDLDDPQASARVILDAIENKEYEKRLPAIMEARERVLTRYGLFQNIAEIIADLNANPRGIHHDNQFGRIESTYDARMRRPLSSFWERIINMDRFVPARR